MTKYWNDRSTKTGIPVAVFVLSASIFALGTTEFMIAGLLPVLAADLDVSVPHAGLLISAFAVGMAVGAPAMVVLTLRLPRKTTLLAALVVFIAGNLLAALAPAYDVLLVARVVTALATSAFWAVGAVVTVSLAPENVRARALAILVGGLTVANVVGVPLGTFIGQQLGWRSAFWAVALLAAAALAGVARVVPDTSHASGPSRLRAELVAFRGSRLWMAFATIALFQAGVFCAFSYLAPLVTDVAGLPEASVPLVLAAFGVGGVLGVQLGGRFADAHPWATLYGGLVSTIAVLTLLAVSSRSQAPTVILVFALGVAAFTLAAPLTARVFALAGRAPTLASATTTSAFNVGNTVGPLLGGIVIAGGYGYAAPPWVGALLATGALALALSSRRLDRRANRQPVPDLAPAECTPAP